MTLNLTLAAAAAVLSGLIPAIVLLVMITCKKWKLLSLIKGLLLYLAVSIGLSPLVYNALYSSVSSLTPAIASLILAAAMTGFELIVIYGITRGILSKEKDQNVKRDMVLGYGFGYCFSAFQVCFRNLVITDHIRIQDFAYLNDVLQLTNEQTETFIQAYSHNIGLSFLAMGLQALMMIVIYRLVFKNVDQMLMNHSKTSVLKAALFLFLANVIIYEGSLLLETVLFSIVLIQIVLVVLYLKKEKDLSGRNLKLAGNI